MPLTSAARVPLATYRLQLSRDMTFEDVERIVPYLADLGVDTLYLSPILLSAPGSTHGYDVTDYRRIDADLGGRAAFDRMAARAREAGLGILLDVVPNHMGIDGPFNPWWREVLEAGRDAPRARFFDIFWQGHADARIHLPVLDDHYGRVLESGRLPLQYEDGGFSIGSGRTTFPLRLESSVTILAPVADTLPPTSRDALLAWCDDVAALGAIPAGAVAAEGMAERASARTALKGRLAELVRTSPALATALDQRLSRLNGSTEDPRSFDALDRLIDAQHYRLARWQTGAHETNYRRFFGIDSLIGLRIEQADVFRDTHALIRQLIADGQVEGLRIDHVDGLRDPQQYLARIQHMAAGAELGAAPFFVVVEKILAPHERLRASWTAHGTTGYEFIRDLSGLFVDASAEERLSRLYAEVTGDGGGFSREAERSKRLMLEDVLANTASMLSSTLADLIQHDRRWRDLTRHELRAAILDIVVGLRVYRTYRRPAETVTTEDVTEIEEATRLAMRRHPLATTEAFQFVCDILTGRYPSAEADSVYRERLEAWSLTVQQHTGAVMAKAVEDTAFYTYNRFVALNEVGGDPARVGIAPDDVHRRMAQRQADTPHSLVATSTHDTKLSEDARARLLALPEFWDEWEASVREWLTANRRYTTLIAGEMAPDANEQYRLYQELLAVWPGDDSGIDDRFRDRIRQHVRKTINEARRHSSWQHPREDWLRACDQFISALLTESDGPGFVSSMQVLANRVAPCGAAISLAQLVIKAMAPGVPDFYQGSELWAFHLVDPDNRQRIEFGARHELAERCASRSWSDLLANWRDGQIKLRVTRDLLRFRRAYLPVFQRGGYRPIAVRGTAAASLFAFARVLDDTQVLVVVPRRIGRLTCPPVGRAWAGTAVESGMKLREVFTGRVFEASETIDAEALLEDLPCAVLVTGD